MAETRPPAPKAAKLDGEARGAEGAQKETSEEEQQTLEKVVSIQHEIDQLNEKASEEILHVEQKYNKLRQPHYTRRSELISSIPDFWHNTLINNPQFSDLLMEEDSYALQYLTNLTVEEYEETKSGYKITLHFRENPYFTNKTLCKEVVMERSGETKVTGTTIHWKDGKNLTAPSLDNGRKRSLEETSFFTWFSEDSTIEEPGEIIRDDIWPNPLQFYLGGSDPGLNETYEDEEEEEEEEEERGGGGVDDDEDDEGLEEEEEEEEDQEVINLSDGDDFEEEDEDDV